MINLAEGIEERTTKEVTEKVTQQVTKEMNESFVMNLYKLGYTYIQISRATKLNIDDIKAIIESKVN